jgi:VIT1/CCC1 family predicted Fe2+/Mn2+ transporter
MERRLAPGSWTILLARFRDAASRRSWTIEANDGIVATAGILLGFARAGASHRVLLFTAAAATIAGAVGVGGAEWAEDAAERESQLILAQAEQKQIATNPLAEIDELANYWEGKGLTPDLAHEVAEQLSARDALAAQLESEHGFDEPMPRFAPLWTGVTAGIAYMIGAVIPLLITYFAPVKVETWAILTAVLIALALTSLVSARASHLVPRRMLARTIAVGAAVVAVSFVAGELLL